jgi:hypothetical protein
MTGCPNGCARPYNSDVGLVGKTVGKYTVFLGGRLLGNRMNFLYKDLVPADEVVAALVPPLVYFKQSREEGESFGDFCDRMGKDALLAFAEKFAAGESHLGAAGEEAPGPRATAAEEAAGEDRRRVVELLANVKSPAQIDQLAFLLGLPLDRKYETRDLLKWADNCCGGIEQLLSELQHVLESEPVAARAENNGSISNGAANHGAASNGAAYAATLRRSLESMNGQQNTTSVISENLYLKLTLDRDPSLYTAEEQEHFMSALANLLQITPVVIERQPGAVKLNLKLTPEETQRLLAAAKELQSE